MRLTYAERQRLKQAVSDLRRVAAAPPTDETRRQHIETLKLAWRERRQRRLKRRT